MPRKAPHPNLEPEVIQTYFDALIDQIKTGQCASLKDAQIRAFAALRQREGAWADKPFGPLIVDAIMAQLSDEQRAEVHKFFPPIQPKGFRNPERNIKTEKFGSDAELRTRFLTSVAEGLSRPALAIEYDIPLELVTTALTHAILGEDLAIKTPGARYVGRIASRLIGAVERVSNSREGWNRLSELVRGDFSSSKYGVKNTPNLRFKNWAETPTEEEIDVYKKLLLDKKGSLADDVVDGDTLTRSGETPTGGFSQHAAKLIIGNGGSVERGGRR
jgi:hypothetical protein